MDESKVFCTFPIYFGLIQISLDRSKNDFTVQMFKSFWTRLKQIERVQNFWTYRRTRHIMVFKVSGYRRLRTYMICFRNIHCKLSSVILLCLLRIFMKQMLWWEIRYDCTWMTNIFAVYIPSEKLADPQKNLGTVFPHIVSALE